MRMSLYLFLQQRPKTAGLSSVKKFAIIFAAQVNLGVVWVFQYYSLFTSDTNTFHYLFAISISSNGVLMLFSHFFSQNLEKSERKPYTQMR